MWGDKIDELHVDKDAWARRSWQVDNVIARDARSPKQATWDDLEEEIGGHG
jgi:hypothetical protein